MRRFPAQKLPHPSAPVRAGARSPRGATATWLSSSQPATRPSSGGQLGRHLAHVNAILGKRALDEERAALPVSDLRSTRATRMFP